MGWPMFFKPKITGALVTLLLLATGCGSTPGSVPADTTQQQDAQQQTAQNTAPQTQEQKDETKSLEWNTEDMNVETNGNIEIAVELLKSLSAESIKKQAITADPAIVMKSPWKYYGKIVKFTAEVGLAQDYPPGSDESQVLGGTEVGELVIANDLNAIIDYLHIGSTGDIKVGDRVTVYGYPVGLGEVENKLGGTTTQLVVVGKVVEKAK